MSNIDNAVAEMKRQLRAESKSTLIKQWIGLYAQVVQLSEKVQNLEKQLSNQNQAIESAEEVKND